MSWIKCSERMPPDGAEVLFYVAPDEYVDAGVYCGSYNSNADTWAVAYDLYEGDNWRRQSVTHWMPMPEPP